MTKPHPIGKLELFRKPKPGIWMWPDIWQNVRLVAPGLACVFMAGNGVLLLAGSAHGQIIPDNTLGTESSVVNSGDLIDLIEGGATRGSGLFHSFEDFNVDAGQQVYFANPVGIENILSRVTGLNPSEINGLLGVDGPANLFFLNPNGIVFGPDAQLDVDGAFLATTSDRFQFADGSEFRATNPNEAPLVTVNIPLGLQLGPDSPTALVNEANLETGSDLTLSAGSVTSTGALSAPSGTIRVEGRSGNVQVQSVEAQSAVLSASENLVLEESRLVTEGDLSLVAEQTVRVRDSEATPFLAAAGGNLLVQGAAGIDILALNHLDVTPFQGGGNLQLISDGIVSGDTHFDSGGGFQILDTAGNPGEFVSLYDPIIRADGDVSFGEYTGASLLVEATGDIETTGSITVTEPDEGSGVALLDENAAVILRAGVDPTTLNDNFPDPPPPLVITEEGTDFTKTPGGGGNLTIGGNITAEDTVGNASGYIELEATGDITLNGSLTAVDNSTILLQGNTVIGNNSVTLTADIVDFDTTVDLDGRSLTILGDEINFRGEVTPGNGSLTLAPLSADRNITVGNNGQANPNPGALDLTATELNFLDSGNFDQITIGRADGTGTVNLRALGDNDFQSDVAIAGGGELLGPNNRSNWTTTGANAGVLDLTPGQAGGEITFQNFVAIDAGNQQDFLIGTSGADVFTVEADPPGTAPNARGERVTINGTTFEDIEQINALGGNDTVVFNGPLFDGPIAGGAGNLTIRGNEINFGNDASEAVSGNGNLLIEPLDPLRRILLGASDDPAKDLELTPSDIQRLEEGFDSITFATGGNIIVRDSAVTFQDPLILDAGNTVGIERALSVAENATVTLQGNRVDIDANVTARSGDINIASNDVTVDNATLNVSGIGGNPQGGNIRIGSAIAGNDLQPADSIRINANNATLDAGDDPNNGGVIRLAAPSFTALSYEEEDLIARQIFLLVPNPRDNFEPDENGEAVFQNVTIRAANGDGGLTVNGITAPFGILPDPSAENSFFFSDVFIEDLPNGTPIALVATDQFTVEDLLTSLEVSPRFSEFRAGNAFLVEAGDTIVAPSDFRIAAVGPVGNNTIATLTVGGVSSINGSISLDSVGSLNVEGDLSAANDLTVTSVETLTLQGNIATTSGNASFSSADNLNVIGSNANITVGGDATFSSTGTLTVSRSDSDLTANNGSVSFIADESLSASGNNFRIVTGGGNVSFTSGDTLTVAGTGSSITTNGGDVELNADDTITLDRDIDSSPPGNTQGGDIRVLATQGDINITSDLTSRNGGSGNFSEIRIEAANGTVTLSGAGVTAENPKNSPGNAIAGNIRVNASDEIQILNGSNLSTDGGLGRIFVGPSTPADTLIPTRVRIVDSSLTTTNGVTNGEADAGNIQVSGQQLAFEGSTIRAGTSGEGAAGTITVTSLGDNDAAIADITISDSQIRATTSSLNNDAADAGTIALTAQNGGDISIANSSTLSSSTSGAGNSGNVVVNANSLSVTEGSVIQAGSDATGAPGSIEIVVSESVRVGGIDSVGRLSELSTSSGPNAFSSTAAQTAANPGRITVQGPAGQPTQSLELTNRGRINALTRSTDATQAGGDIQVTVDRLTIGSGGQIVTSSSGAAAAGNIVVNATEGINISGTAAPLQSLFDTPTIVRSRGDVQLEVNNQNQLQSLFLTSGTGAISVDVLEEFLGLAPDTVQDLNNPLTVVEGSGVQLVLADGDLAYTWNFATDESTPAATFNDLSFETVNGTTAQLADTNFAGGNFQPSASLAEETGNQNVPAIALNGDENVVNFGVVDVEDGNFTSGLVLTNITLDGNPVTVVAPQEDIQLDQTFSSGIFAQATTTGDAGTITVNTPTLDLTDGAEISGSTVSGAGNDINLNGLNGGILNALTVDNALISASTESQAAGNITVNANQVNLSGTLPTIPMEPPQAAGILAAATDGGEGGDVTLNTSQLTVQSGAAIAAGANGTSGVGGDVAVNAGSINVTGTGSEISAAATEGGTAGDIEITATAPTDAVRITAGGAIESSASGAGGVGGSVTINASTIEVTGADSEISAAATDGGAAGDINITATAPTDALQITAGGAIESSAGANGTGGSVTVNADTIDVAGANSAIAAAAADGGSGGSIVLSTRQLVTRGGASVAASGTGTGTAGAVQVTAEAVEVTGTESTISASAESGAAGSVTVNAGTLDVTDNGSISVSSGGVAGGLDIAADFVVLENGSLTAETGATGDANSARIRLDLTNEDAPDNVLWLRDESLISATANGAANGGNIEITGADFILANVPSGPEGSDIVASAVDGDGGNIDIEALGVIGIQVRPERTPLNDITASSEAGVQGTVTVNTLATDPDSGLAELAFEFIDASDQATNQCVVDSGEASSVRVAGRGGLPTMPTDVLGAIAPSDEDWVTLDSTPEPEEVMQSTLAEEAAFAAGVESDRPQAVCHRAYRASQESI